MEESCIYVEHFWLIDSVVIITGSETKTSAVSTGENPSYGVLNMDAAQTPTTQIQTHFDQSLQERDFDNPLYSANVTTEDPYTSPVPPPVIYDQVAPPPAVYDQVAGDNPVGNSHDPDGANGPAPLYSTVTT